MGTEIKCQLQLRAGVWGRKDEVWPERTRAGGSLMVGSLNPFRGACDWNSECGSHTITRCLALIPLGISKASP